MQMVPDHKNLRVITREIVSALIFSADEKLLMGKKDPSQGGVYADCWHIPGGGVDDEEDKLTALHREIAEETSLNTKDAIIELIDDRGHGATEKILKTTGEKVWCKMKFNVYKVTLNQKTQDIALNPTDDLIELRWFGIDELSAVQLTPPSQELFRRLGYIN